MEVDERQLVENARTGDRRAFDLLMERHEDRVFAVCLRTLRDRESALDATQDTFLTVFRKIDQFRGDAAFGTWIYRIAMNTCYDRLRSAKRRPTEPLPEAHDPIDPSTEDAITAVELRPDLVAALAQIPDEFRSAIVLVDAEGWSVNDAADVLGVASGTIKSRLHRGRKLLAGILGNQTGAG